MFKWREFLSYFVYFEWNYKNIYKPIIVWKTGNKSKHSYNFFCTFSYNLREIISYFVYFEWNYKNIYKPIIVWKTGNKSKYSNIYFSTYSYNSIL